MASVTITIPNPTWLLRALAVTMAPAMVIIMGIDLRIRGQERILIHGIADECAHTLTALIALAAVYALGFRINWVTGAVGGVLLDVDYVLLDEQVITTIADSSRGVMHTLGPTLAVLVLGVIIPPLRVVLLSLGLGMLTHLVRDSATAETPLLWPLSDEQLHLRYSHYLIIMVGLTVITTGVVALGARRSRADAGEP